RCSWCGRTIPRAWSSRRGWARRSRSKTRTATPSSSTWRAASGASPCSRVTRCSRTASPTRSWPTCGSWSTSARRGAPGDRCARRPVAVETGSPMALRNAYDALGEAELVAAVLAGEPAAWPTFFARYERLIISCIRKVLFRYHAHHNEEDLEDLVSATALNLVKDDYKKLRTFDRS